MVCQKIGLHFLNIFKENYLIFKEWFEGLIAYKWLPMWSYCNPCIENMEPNSILDLKHLNEDKDYIFDLVGFNHKFNWVPFKNQELPGDIKIQKKYYSTLSKQEIYELYMKYRLDHELFGYKPDSFINMGQ